ncbi:MAG TPA: TlpA disulfide reductase family protein [Solirubrobacteraceae bacterium]|nr:TlpA disulfide reductase family protein [Solirubrobacteraceae bacterium]
MREGLSPRSKRRAALGFFGLAALVAAAVFGLAGTSGVSGRPAPGLPGAQLSGPPANLTGLLSSAHGKPVLVVFWASWCGPCSREAPALERFSRSSEGRARIVGVDWSDARTGGRSFIARYGWTFPNLSDPQGTVGNAYGITGLPTTFVVNDRHRIVAELRGPQSQASLDRALASAEGGGSAQA